MFLEAETKDVMRISKEALVKDVSTQFGQRTSEKSVENPHYIFCSSFPNLRLGSIKLQKECAHAACEFEEAPVGRTMSGLCSENGLFGLLKSSFGGA
jgi:hypothetical protein